MWSHYGLIHLQVCGSAAQALNVDAPLLRIETEHFESTSLAREFDGVNVLISSVVSSARVAFGIFIRHGRAEGVEDSARGEIFGGDEDNRFALALNFEFLASISMYGLG